jgi:glycosyltransferase involved in cell wall biosynthesis
VRVLLWHGWLLEGSGSNVYAAKTAEALRRAGHDVLLLCQDRHPERFSFIDAWGTIDAAGPSALKGQPDRPNGQVVVVRPEMGPLLPVFVIDEYEGFDRVVPFVDLTARELAGYLKRNVAALRAAVEWWRPEVAVMGHVIPGAVVGHRAIGPGGYVAKVHGSDLEYAIRPQRRYADLAREALGGARAVVGPSRDALDRTVVVAPAIADRIHVLPPGVDVERFVPRLRRQALEEAAALLDADPDTARGRPDSLDAEAVRAGRDGGAGALDALAARYDQSVPDPGAAARVRALASFQGPLVGYIGKFIPQKGVDLLLEALARVDQDVRALIVGFGSHREHLAARTIDLGLADRVAYTGRLDHRYAPQALAALDVLVVPSILDEAFGMVAAEGAAAGALPLVARHSGLAEVAAALEAAASRPGLFSFEPGHGAPGRIAAGLRQLLDLPVAERARLRRTLSRFVGTEWTWDRTAERLLEAALTVPPGAPPPGTPAPPD